MFLFLIFGFLLFSLISAFVRLYKRCPSNKILVIFGRVGKNKSVRCCHGGGAIIFPLIQGSAFMDLTPRTIHIPLKGALSQQNIRINVPSTFTVAVGTHPEIMENAAVRLLGLSTKDIEMMAAEIIVGQLRLTVASLKIEEINQDRERFLDAIRKNITSELHKIGLTLINVNITDITDESGYIESIGKKAAATAVYQAKVDVAQEEKKGEIGKATADTERRIEVANAQAEAIRGENLAKAKVAMTQAELSEQEAEADKRAKVAFQEAEVDIQKARAEAEKSRLDASSIVPEQIEKTKQIIQSEAVAQKRAIEAKAEADAYYQLELSKANALTQLLDAKATGFEKLIQSCGGDTSAASTLLIIEKLEEIVRLQVEAIQNIKIDRITVWDGGAKEGKEQGTSTSEFLKNLVHSLPPLHDVVSLAGIQLPDYLGKIAPASAPKNSVPLE
ncbi:MAG: SPFH domain-containing protein [Chlamydiota bacterium]